MARIGQDSNNDPFENSPSFSDEQPPRRPRAPQPPADEDHFAFKAPQTDTTRYRIKQKPPKNNDKIIIAIAAVLVLALIIGLLTIIFGGNKKAPEVIVTPSPAVVVMQPTLNYNEPVVTPAPTPTPSPTPPPLMREGAEGDDVLRMQSRLIELGYLSEGDDDGIFGKGTSLAVQAFQKQAQLDVDGIAGQQTTLALFAENAPTAAPPTEATAAADETPDTASAAPPT